MGADADALAAEDGGWSIIPSPLERADEGKKAMAVETEGKRSIARPSAQTCTQSASS